MTRRRGLHVSASSGASRSRESFHGAEALTVHGGVMATVQVTEDDFEAAVKELILLATLPGGA